MSKRMSNMSQFDSEVYAEMSKPFTNRQEATVAVASFSTEVSLLRKKYRIAEVVVLFQVYLDEGNGEILVQSGSQTCGDYRQSLSLVTNASLGFQTQIINNLAAQIEELKK